MFASDPRVLPIVYDFPACDSVVNTSLLGCPRVPDPSIFTGGSAVGLGELLDRFAIGIHALKGVVGVMCEGKLYTYVPS